MNSKDKRELISTRVREARRMVGLSQGQVAKMLGLKRPSITEMEAGNRAISAEEISKLAEIFDVSALWLLGEGVTRVDKHDDRLQLAARELRKLKGRDLERLLTLFASMREQEKNR